MFQRTPLENFSATISAIIKKYAVNLDLKAISFI